MDVDISAPVVDDEPDPAHCKKTPKTAIDPFCPTNFSTDITALPGLSAQFSDLLAHAIQLEVNAKVALICTLLAQLEPDQMQAILQFGQLKSAKPQQQATALVSAPTHRTCLLLKKDYTYQERGLSEPAQYYVYLRCRKPKLDRYIGTLFYIPQGCVLSYFLDLAGRILFNPPRNTFRLKDSHNPANHQVVRLICLEPPPPEYTFTRHQDDVPEIHLRLQYLDPTTYQLIAEEVYPFPLCMYEGGKLDRYRWEVSAVIDPSEMSTTADPAVQPSPATQPSPAPASSEPSAAPRSVADKPGETASKLSRRVIELPQKSSVFYLANRRDSPSILERMRLWVAWSEKAIPQSRWEIVQHGTVHTLRNASFKRKILSFSSEQRSVVLEHSLPVLVKSFQDLSLAVSQTQNQRLYSPAQLKLAHSLFVDMSLPQDNPLVTLKILFGVGFRKEG